MNKNEFKEENSHDPMDKICCLQEEGFRCQQQAGKTSYDKKTCHTVQQLQLHLDALAGHNYICNYHENMIQYELQSSSQNETPEVDFSKLHVNSLRRYKKQFKILTNPSMNKAEMAKALFEHFKRISVNEKEVLTFFIHSIKTNSNRLDQKSSNNNKLDRKSSNNNKLDQKSSNNN